MPDNKETIEYTEENGSIHIVAASPRIRTSKDVIEHFDIDTDIWKLDKFKVKTSEGYRKDRRVEWEVNNGIVEHGYVDDSGKMLVVPMCHTETWFVRKELDDLTRADFSRMFENFQPKVIAPKIHPKQYSLTGKMWEFCLADPHFGRYYADQDEKPLEDRLKKTMKDVLSKVGKTKLRYITFAPLGDIFNSDTKQMTTTNGTPQQNIMSPFIMYSFGLEWMVWIMDQLRLLAPVRYVCVPGNHDELTSFHLAKNLEAYYRNVKDVTFIIDESSKHVWDTFGVNLIGWTHGDIPKKRLHTWLPSKARREWGNTKYAEIHCGHTNNELVIEDNGHIVRFCPTVAAASIWEDDQAYAGQRKATQSFIWDSANGLEQIYFSNI